MGRVYFWSTPVPSPNPPLYPTIRVMRRSSQCLISAISLAVILAGARYAYSREAVRHTDLDTLYQQINRESFEGKLPKVDVTWDDLTAEDAYGITEYGLG